MLKNYPTEVGESEKDFADYEIKRDDIKAQSEITRKKPVKFFWLHR